MIAEHHYTFALDEFHRSQPDVYDAEASELGLRPGFWPEQITVNAIRLTRIRLDAHGATYHTPIMNLTIIIFND